jgi:hypothetical protein
MQDSRLQRLQELICNRSGSNLCMHGRRLSLEGDGVLRPEGQTGPMCRLPAVHYTSPSAFREPCEVFCLMQELDKELSEDTDYSKGVSVPAIDEATPTE